MVVATIAQLMIFENDQVTELVIEWQRTGKPELMAKIIEMSTSLIEVIISGYDSTYRDDMFQESASRIQYACKSYNPKKGNLHTFLTTVVHHEMIRFLGKQSKDYLTEDLEICTDDMAEDEDSELDTDKLSELRCHNRERFPSIYAEDVDKFTTMIYRGLANAESYSMIVRELSKLTSRHIALVFFNSTMAYLRSENLECAKSCASKDGELTLAPDLKAVIGDDLYQKVCMVFGGMNIKVTG